MLHSSFSHQNSYLDSELPEGRAVAPPSASPTPRLSLGHNGPQEHAVEWMVKEEQRGGEKGPEVATGSV